MKYELPVEYDKLDRTERRAVREQYVREQGGLCYYCKAPLSSEAPHSVTRRKIRKELFPESFFQYPVHLHHSHLTGLTIGAVHCHCNAVLWQFHGE